MVLHYSTFCYFLIYTGYIIHKLLIPAFPLLHEH
nr:MAG TPA: hypothetical protein [Caudoviricetes sp.]